MNAPAPFQAKGLKVTLPRLRVMDVFAHSPQRHLTAEDVYRALLAQGEELGLSTVYKVLSQFEQTGVLTRSELGQGRTVYELNNEQAPWHGHLVCTRTGQVTEFVLPGLDDQLRALAAHHGLTLGHCVITAYGHPADSPAPSEPTRD